MREAAGSPLVFDRDAILASDIDLRHTTGDGIEACCKYYQVEIPLITAFQLDAVFSKCHNWIPFDIYNVHVVLIER